MLKIKSNINEFTIIFLRRFERKMNAKESPSASTRFSVSFLLQRPFCFFSFLPWLAHRLSLYLSSASFSFSFDVLRLFSPSVDPKTFFSSAQHISFFFLFCSVFSSPFLFQFSASFCCFCSACLSLVFSSSLLLFCRHVTLLSSAFYFFSPKPF